MSVEVKIAMEHNPVDAGLERIGEPSSFACPECHGVLLQLKEGTRTRFRCHTGHAYSVNSLLAAIGEGDRGGDVDCCPRARGGSAADGAHGGTRAGARSRRSQTVVPTCRRSQRQSEVIRQLLIDRDPLPAETKEKGRPTGSTP